VRLGAMMRGFLDITNLLMVSRIVPENREEEKRKGEKKWRKCTCHPLADVGKKMSYINVLENN